MEQYNKSKGRGKNNIRIDFLIAWSLISIVLVTFIDIEIFHPLVNNIEEHYYSDGAHATGIPGMIFIKENFNIIIENYIKFLIIWLLGIFTYSIIVEIKKKKQGEPK